MTSRWWASVRYLATGDLPDDDRRSWLDRPVSIPVGYLLAALLLLVDFFLREIDAPYALRAPVFLGACVLVVRSLWEGLRR